MMEATGEPSGYYASDAAGLHTLLGRVEKSVERPSGDTTVYAYTPAGRLESDVREGQVWYSRYYGYNLDGSRAMVMRDDALNGTHWDMYGYDSASGRLVSVTDTVPEPDVVHSFAWNPEGTLARWSSNEPNSYARVFGYDEEGRLVKIERDHGGGNLELAYEYGYNSDGTRVWKRDVLNRQEYRYVCGIGCGGVPMRVYNRPTSGGSWTSVEDYLRTPTVIAYTHLEGTFGHYVWTSGHWLADWTAGGGWMYYQDQFGVEVGTEFFPAALPKPAPLYLGQDEGILGEPCTEGYIPVYAIALQQKDEKPEKPKPSTPFSKCLEACGKMREDQENECRKDHAACVEKCGGKPECVRNCDNALSDCIQRVSGRVTGCAQRCSQVHLGTTITVEIGVGLGTIPFPLPTGSYDQWCSDEIRGGRDPRKRYPDLPPPTRGWPVTRTN